MINWRIGDRVRFLRTDCASETGTIISLVYSVSTGVFKADIRFDGGHIESRTLSGWTATTRLRPVTARDTYDRQG